MLSQYWKAVIAATAAAGSVVAAITNDVDRALADHSITAAEWWFIAIAVGNAIGVYAKANTNPPV